MSTNRKSIPVAIKRKVLEEFNSACAICGNNGNPHLHHIDENNSNNDVLNLIPLCPNCHLQDQHSPTQKINPGILSLFRKFKDPTILSPQFVPLFKRMRFLVDLSSEDDYSYLCSSVSELLKFIACLEMGEFYKESLKKQTSIRFAYGRSFDEPSHVTQAREKQFKKEAFQILTKNKDAAIELLIELLNYQGWEYKKSK